MANFANNFNYNYNKSVATKNSFQQQPQSLAERYYLTKKVGDGTFGEVSLAKKLDTGDLVAIKRYIYFFK